jgi:hypothetical protein
MKKIIKEDLSAVAFSGDKLGYPNIPRTVEYPHDSHELAEIAGHVLNRRLGYREQKDYRMQGTNVVIQLNCSNPHNTSLYQTFYISDLEKIMSQAPDIKYRQIEKAVESLLSKAMDNVHTVYMLEKSFWARLKYLFTKNLK